MGNIKSTLLFGLFCVIIAVFGLSVMLYAQGLPEKIHGFSLGMSLKAAQKTCLAHRNLFHKIGEDKKGKLIYRCFIPGNEKDRGYLVLSSKQPLYTTMEFKQDQIASLSFVFSRENLYRDIKGKFDHQYARQKQKDLYTDQGTVVHWYDAGQWVAYFQAQKNTYLIQIYGISIWMLSQR